MSIMCNMTSISDRDTDTVRLQLSLQPKELGKAEAWKG